MIPLFHTRQDAAALAASLSDEQLLSELSRQAAKLAEAEARHEELIKRERVAT